MTDCVNKLNANNWDGTECKPNAANGTELGSSFGFYPFPCERMDRTSTSLSGAIEL